MALSYYSNWDTLIQHDLIEETTKLPPELYNDSFALPPDDDDDSYFNIAQFFEPEPEPESNYFFSPSENNYIHPLPPLPPPPPPPHNNNQFQELFHFQPPADYTLKRQRLDYEQQQQLIMYSDEQLMGAGSTNYNQLDHDQMSGYMLPDQFAVPGFSSSANRAPPAAAISLSAQSIAARQRRRKISEKTQELGKLIPGANKLNTAEMFQAAYKYIQFLQAQVGILEFMGSKGELMIDESEDEKTMHGLLGSTLVQEKLYATEKCIVPRKFADGIKGFGTELNN